MSIAHLLIDRGNSQIKAVWYTVKQCRTWQADQIQDILAMLPPQPPDAIWIADVTHLDQQQTLYDTLTQHCQAPIYPVRVAHYQHHLPTRYAVDQLGVDRWLAMLACYQRSQGSCLVVDCGTAATFDWVDHAGTHQGGYILPGVHLMQQSLWQNTAIPACQSDQTMPQLARDTATAITRGSHQALVSLMQHMLQEMPHPATLCIGGGAGHALLPYLTVPYIWVPDMVIQGLIYLANLEQP